MKWNEMKWNAMQWNETKIKLNEKLNVLNWIEINGNEMEMQWIAVNWNEIN